MPEFVVRFDQLLHDWVFNPVFKWIQRWFHWNRFDLILGFLILIILCGLVGFSVMYQLSALDPTEGHLSVHGPSVLDKWLTLYWSVVGSALLVVLWRPLREASIHYELTGRVSAFVKRFAGSATLVRQLLNFGLASIPITFIKVALINWPKTDLIGAVTMLCLLFFLHLWHADDIDPDDRESIFDPETARDRS